MTPQNELDLLLTNLENSVGNVIEYFEGPGAITQAMVGEWGAWEILCHCLLWHRVTIDGIESSISLGTPSTLDAETDEMNALFIAQHRGESMSSLVKQARELQERLMHVARALPDLDTIVVRRPDPDGGPVTARARLERITKHWPGHMEELRRQSTV